MDSRLENGMMKHGLVANGIRCVALCSLMLWTSLSVATEDKYHLRIQTHHGPKTVSGELVAQFCLLYTSDAADE